MITCKEVIISDLTTRGKGITHSPIRRIIQVFEKDGTLIAENDPSPETFCTMDLVHFGRYLAEQTKNNSIRIDENTVHKWLDTISIK